MSARQTSPAAYSEAQRRAAAEWFVAIHTEEEPGAETLQAWLQWMEQAKEHRLAFEAIAQAWRAVPESAQSVMPTAEELRLDSYDGELPLERWLATSSSRDAQEASPNARESRISPAVRLQRRNWLAAAVLVLATLAGSLMISRPRPDSPAADTFITKSGEQIQITLVDGSNVWLGPKSSLQVQFTPARRALVLAAGEAFFTVHKDRTRPFVVRSRGGDITAVGTAFNVRTVTDQVTVAVSEGVVTVASGGQQRDANQEPVRVASGQQLTFTAHQALQPSAITQSPTLGERARWRDGVLVYHNEPLRDVVSDVSRYSEEPIVLSGDAVGAMRYSGVVKENAVDEWLGALPESFPVRIVDSGREKTILPR